MKKKLTAMLLIMSMVCTFLPVSAMAAENGTAEVSTTDEFFAAVEDSSVTTITLKNDLDFSELFNDKENPKVFDLSDCTLDLNGHTITSKHFTVIYDGANFTIKNGTIASSNGSDYPLFIGENPTANVVIQDIKMDGGINVYNATNVVLKNVDITSGTYYAVWCDQGAQVTIESGIFREHSTKAKNALLGVTDHEDSKLNIKDGTFETNKVPLVLPNQNGNEAVFISDGTFTKDSAPIDVTNYLDANLTQNSEGTIVPMDVADAAAKVGNDYYKSLLAAVKAANNGETVTLLKDATENVIIPKGKTLTFDLNGKTLSAKEEKKSTVVVNGGNLTVTDSTVGQPVVGDDHKTVTYPDSGVIQNTTADVVTVANGGTLNVKGGTLKTEKGSGIFAVGDTTGKNAIASTINMTGGYVEAQEYGIGVIGKGATLTMDGGVVKSRDNGAVAGNGTVKEGENKGGTTITINGGTLIGEIQSAGYVACGIYHPQEGILNVNGGNIYVHGGAGIVARSGAATINNVNIVTTGDTTGKVGDSRVVVPCSAVVVDEDANYPGGGLDTDIKGGNFVSAEGVANVTLVGKTNDKLTISGGDFSAPVPKDNLDDALKIEVKDPQDKDTPYSYYPSVEEALKNEKGDQLEMKDVTVTDSAQSCTVTLESGYDGIADSKVTLNKDSVFKLPNLDREGYTFVGWKDANDSVHQAGEEVTVKDNVTFTAVWESNSTGGGTVVKRYDITLADTDNGSITATHKRASKNSTVTITATPADGYVVDAVTVTEKDGDKVEVTKKDNNKYTFKMPASDVTVKVTFKAEQTEPEQPSDMPFTDVAKDAWYFPAVEYVFNNGLMNGTTATTFAPNVNLNRAMMAAVLYNMEGKPACDKSGIFSDVADGKWYTDAVNWAASNNIVSGMPDGTYAPDQALTREQMASILYRYAEYKGIDVSARADLSTFTDGTTVSPWAQDVVQWAVAEKLMSGNGNELQPKGTATRAQVATVLMNYCENVAK